MSLILDALRNGRPRPAPRPASNTAQTDAVLQTLGYVRPAPPSPFLKARRVALGASAAIAVLMLAIWVLFAVMANAHRTQPVKESALSTSSAARPLPAVRALTPHTTLSVPVTAADGAIVSGNDHFQLALYYQRIGDFENSLVHYRAVLQREELNADAHNNLGLLYYDKGLVDDAIREFLRAIAIDQRSAGAHNNLGVAYMSRGETEAAAREFQTALTVDPQNADVHANLALITSGKPAQK